MRGKYTIVVQNRRVRFSLEIKRNITVIRGDSATGKTTLIGMLRDYEEQGKQSGISVQSDRPCCVLNGPYWETSLARIRDSIVFIDEGNSFVTSKAFAEAIRGTSNYYVIVTRENLYQLPYSVEAVLELRATPGHSSGQERFVYNTTYPRYQVLSKLEANLGIYDRVLTEDSNAGNQMFECLATQAETTCVSAKGKSNIFGALAAEPKQKTLVVADGAGFGAEMEHVYQLQRQSPNQVSLYLPESFEWLLLTADVIRNNEVKEILAEPESYIDSEQYFSWEQYFTDLLISVTADSAYMRYSKLRLLPFYLQEENIRKVLRAISGAKS